VRILYFADIRFPLERANGVQTMQTCWALAARGHRVALAVRPDSAGVARDPFSFYGLPVSSALSIERVRVAGPPALRRALYLFRAVARSLGRRRADAILTRDLGVASAVLSLPRSLRPPVVYESHGFAPEVGRALPDLVTGAPAASGAKQRRLANRERHVWRRADGYVTITESLAAELGAMFGDRDRQAAVPDGVRLDPGRRFVAPPVRRPATVGYAGNLYPWKGVDILLRALAQLPDVRGLIIGGHPAEPDIGRLEALAAALGLDERVTFTRQLDPPQVMARLGEADVLVLPNTATAISSRYTSPLKLFEYLAAGRPIVASDLPALSEVLREGDTAVLVAPGDPGALARGIRRVLDDAGLAGRLARGAFVAAAEYSWDRRAERLERLIESAIGAQPPGGQRREGGAR
jgi:glycosyltransferase involved in cell wall biosynthesis